MQPSPLQIDPGHVGLDKFRRDVAAANPKRINPAKVVPGIRPKLEAYQSEVADAIESYFTCGVAVNPRILPERRYKLAAEILAIAPPTVSPTWVEQKYRHLVALSLGEEPDVAEEDRLLTVDEYSQDRGIKGKPLRSMRTSFGAKLAATYRKHYGSSLKKAPRFVDGTTRSVSVYTERDRRSSMNSGNISTRPTTPPDQPRTTSTGTANRGARFLLQEETRCLTNSDRGCAPSCPPHGQLWWRGW
ncbi:hypothetical protein [Saccharopolyspora pogona]|uniref:hypothetical protein n=1 Tax=Saccharopolyspora pogona TaxID=333966 RepID=UPI0016855AE8|nr:hypothetical protein [Saccharopolyspora pogona]